MIMNDYVLLNHIGGVLKDTGSLFQDLAKEFPSGQYTSFCNKLGVRYNEAKKISKKCLNDYTEATEEVLSLWESKPKDGDGVVSRKDLEKALRDSDAGGLCSIVKEHFEKGWYQYQCHKFKRFISFFYYSSGLFK